MGFGALAPRLGLVRADVIELQQPDEKKPHDDVRLVGPVQPVISSCA
jgi:hypothetical protein